MWPCRILLKEGRKYLLGVAFILFLGVESEDQFINKIKIVHTTNSGTFFNVATCFNPKGSSSG